MTLFKVDMPGVYIVAAVQMLLSIWLADALGFFADIEHVLFSCFDCAQYREITEYLYGLKAGIDPHLLQLRPISYPLYLGLSLWAPLVYVGVQLLLNFFTVILVCRTIGLLTGSYLLVLAGSVFLLTSFTFLLVPFWALTETLTIFLMAAAFFCSAAHFRGHGNRYLYVSLFIWSLLVTIKGIFEPYLLFWLGYVVWRLVRGNMRVVKGIIIIGVCLLPVVMQLGYTAAVLGKPSISSAGKDNFEQRFFPFVYGVAEQGYPAHYRSPLATQAAREYPDTASRLAYLARNYSSVAEALHFLVRDNFARGSTYIIFPEKPMVQHSHEEILWKTSIRINMLVYWLHWIMLPLVLLVLVMDKESRSLVLAHALLVYSVLLLSVLTYNQGDRIVSVTIPAYAVLYLFALFRLDACIKAWKAGSRQVPGVGLSGS